MISYEVKEKVMDEFEEIFKKYNMDDVDVLCCITGLLCSIYLTKQFTDEEIEIATNNIKNNCKMAR